MKTESSGMILLITTCLLLQSSFVRSTNQEDWNNDDDETNSEEQGSGMLLEQAAKSLQCDFDTLRCWCTDLDGKRIKGTRKHARKPDCTKYIKTSPKVSPITRPGAQDPSSTPTSAGKSISSSAMSGVSGSSKTAAVTTLGFAYTEPTKQWFEHAGIKTAIICASVLFILLVLMAVIFTIYRIRKKDEGSYPLNDAYLAKVQKGYAKAPTQEEFFA